MVKKGRIKMKKEGNMYMFTVGLSELVLNQGLERIGVTVTAGNRVKLAKLIEHTSQTAAQAEIDSPVWTKADFR